MEFSKVEDLFEAIDEMPDTIESVNVPTSLDYFNPSTIEVFPGVHDWRSEIKNAIAKTLTENVKGNEVDAFILKSYYGRDGITDPFYIQLESEGSRRFAEQMGSGRYGALD